MSEGYSGGVAAFETLTLFWIEADRLVPVLDVPIGIYKMLAGDWNPDGSRQHDTLSVDFVVDVKPRGSDMADLVLRPRAVPRGLSFLWLSDRNEYGCSQGK